MPESLAHLKLVQLLKGCIVARHGADGGLCIFADEPDVRRGDKPRPVEGFVPDVFAVTVPRSLTIIGEAKSFSDLYTPHSRAQIRAFLRFLRYSVSPRLILAVPAPAHASAHGILTALKLETEAQVVFTEVITPASFTRWQ